VSREAVGESDFGFVCGGFQVKKTACSQRNGTL